MTRKCWKISGPKFRCSLGDVLHTQNQHEKNVARALVSKGFEVLLPLYSTVRRWKDRKSAAFPPTLSLLRLRSEPPTSLASNFVDSRSAQRRRPFGGDPAIVPYAEIEAVQELPRAPLKLSLTHSFSAVIEFG